MNKKSRTKNLIFTVLLILITVLAGAALIFGLLYMYSTGQSDDLLSSITALISESSFGIVIVFLMILIPVLLVLLAVLSVVRRSKIKKITLTWEEAMREAAENIQRERAEREERKKMIPDPRFNMLVSLDSKRRPRVYLDADVTSMRVFCDRFRSFAAGKLGLYYSIDDIREFVSGLAVSHVIILQGISGTGKTSLAYAFGEFIKNPSVIVPVQPMWKERTDLLGYYNEFTKRFNETLLLQKMYEANNSDNIYVVVLDEMNVARVEYYFAEFLSLLEIPNPETRYMDVVPDTWVNDPAGLKDGRVKLPENMWFIGTINNDDSTFAISDKVYDRAMVMDFNKKADRFALTEEDINQNAVSFPFADFVKMVANEQEWFELTTRNERRLHDLDEYLIDKFQITFGNRIMRQIHDYVSVYVACGGEELDALDDILCKKVLRKLSSLNAAYVRSEADNLCRFIGDLFGENHMTRCIGFIRRLEKTL